MDDARRADLGRLADGIEGELERLGLWDPKPPSEDHVVAGGAFGQQTGTPFETWLQVVLLTRLRAVSAGTLEPPKSSSVGAQAARELDTLAGADTLISLLSRVDGLIEGDAPPG